MTKAFLVLLLLAGTALAVPPLDYDAAVAWADQTAPTSIPKEERVYVLGPETRSESYLLDGKPATHVVAARRIVSAKKARSLGDLNLNRFGKMPLSIQVYRGAGGPVFETGNTRWDFALVAGDLVVVRFGTGLIL